MTVVIPKISMDSVGLAEMMMTIGFPVPDCYTNLVLNSIHQLD